MGRTHRRRVGKRWLVLVDRVGLLGCPVEWIMGVLYRLWKEGSPGRGGDGGIPSHSSISYPITMHVLRCIAQTRADVEMQIVLAIGLLRWLVGSGTDESSTNTQTTVCSLTAHHSLSLTMILSYLAQLLWSLIKSGRCPMTFGHSPIGSSWTSSSRWQPPAKGRTLQLWIPTRPSNTSPCGQACKVDRPWKHRINWWHARGTESCLKADSVGQLKQWLCWGNTHRSVSASNLLPLGQMPRVLGLAPHRQKWLHDRRSRANPATRPLHGCTSTWDWTATANARRHTKYRMAVSNQITIFTISSRRSQTRVSITTSQSHQ